MTIINVRGTSGSGKSTVVRKIMAMAPSKDTGYQTDGRRRQPLWYTLKFPSFNIVIPGHYETACGGCDTLKTYDHLFEIIRSAHSCGMHVLFEGLLVAHDKKRTLELWDWLKRDPAQLQVLELTDPLEVCLESVEKRRASRANPPKAPFNPANTSRRYGEVQRSCVILEGEGIPIHRYPRDAAPAVIAHLFKIPASADARA